MYLKSIKIVILLTIIFVAGMILPKSSYAHCDRVNGPVAIAAKKALEKEDISKVLIWVGEQQENELKSKFNQTLEVYKEGGDSKELAETYFMETTVRLHREAEGMPFTGLKPAQPSSNDIQLAEEALNSGSLTPVTKLLAKEIQEKTSELYTEAMKAKNNKEQNVEAGREWVDAYVRYIVYVQGLYNSINAGPAHGVDG